MSDFRFSAVEESGHRRWPVPATPWLMRQTWSELLFAHWPVPAEQVRPLLPKGVQLDLHDGAAWIGIVPFQMSNVSLRSVPNVPYLSAFPELNVRTYVTRDGKPGVWFFSLDAARLAAVGAARLGTGLPYFWAEMSCRRSAAAVQFSSRRLGSGVPAALEVSYEPHGPASRAIPGTLDYFLTERYCLYTVRASRLMRLEIQHPPWLLQAARASLSTNTMLTPLGLRVSPDAPVLHYADRQDMVGWAPDAC